MNYPAPRELAPHNPPMLIVDELADWAEDRLETHYRVRADNLFFMAGRGLPSYVAFEIMAQSISVHDGMERRHLGERPQIGFLLGARQFKSHRDWLQAGEQLVTTVEAVLNEGELRAFGCVVKTETGELIAEAEIKVFRPEDPLAFLESGGKR